MKRIPYALALSFLLLPHARAAQDAPDGAPVVKLVSPGKDPRKALRLTAKVGLKRTMIMSMKMGMEMSLGGNKMPAAKLPETKLTMDMRVTNVAPNGDIRYEFKINKPEVVADPDVMPMVMDAVKKSLAGMKGMTGYAIVSSRGFTREADIAIPPGLDPQMKQFMESTKQSLKQIASPLPEEPVGVGAKWETIMNLNQNGMLLKQVASNELTRLSGDTGTVAIQIKQTADRQKVAAPGMPAGASVELLSLNSTGSGEMNFDLTRLVPSLAKVSLTSNSRMMVEAGGQKNEMATKLDMQMGMQGK